MLSREFGTRDLSLGQWQRVAIARGLFREHDMILLDEPTASIDPLEEQAVYERFMEIAAGTAVLVTHRLGSARLAPDPGDAGRASSRTARTGNCSNGAACTTRCSRLRLIGTNETDGSRRLGAVARTVVLGCA